MALQLPDIFHMNIHLSPAWERFPFLGIPVFLYSLHDFLHSLVVVSLPSLPFQTVVVILSVPQMGKQKHTAAQ